MNEGYHFCKKKIKKDIENKYENLITNRERKIKNLEATINEFETENDNQSILLSKILKETSHMMKLI
jgi:hypothetical protein